MEHLEGEAVVKLRREKSYPIIKELEKWCKEEQRKDERRGDYYGKDRDQAG